MRTRRTTFAFLIASLLGIAGPALAAENPYLNRQLGKSIARASIPCASSNADNMEFVVRDCASAASCATGGTATAFILCDSGTTVYLADSVAVSDDYVPVTAAAQQSIEATGAGNDITLTTADSGDDLLFAAGDALAVTTGGAASVITTAGAVTITAGGTTQDVTVNSIDDIVLVLADALTATVGGAVGVTTTAGAITLTAGGTTQDISLISVDQVILDGEGGADEVTIDAASTTILGAFRLTGSTAPPVACAAGTAGTMYYDSDINKTCICNATNYVLMNDDATTTGCS